MIAKWQDERDDEPFAAVLDDPSPADPDVLEDEPPTAPGSGRVQREPVPALA